jgi:hypothetical protein
MHQLVGMGEMRRMGEMREMREIGEIEEKLLLHLPYLPYLPHLPHLHSRQKDQLLMTTPPSMGNHSRSEGDSVSDSGRSGERARGTKSGGCPYH